MDSGLNIGSASEEMLTFFGPLARGGTFSRKALCDRYAQEPAAGALYMDYVDGILWALMAVAAQGAVSGRANREPPVVFRIPVYGQAVICYDM